MKDHGQVLAQYGDAALQSAFGREYFDLDAEGKRLVLQDFLDANAEDGTSASEYKRRIGAGNLASYADVMRVRARRGW